MNLVHQYWEWFTPPPHDTLERIETAGRICYKSLDKITPGSAEKFVQGLLSMGHLSVLEHVSASVRFVTNRGVTHELVRHRLASFSQESTRYVRYDGGMEFIYPVWQQSRTGTYKMKVFYDAFTAAEEAYISLLEQGATPQEAREVLPNALKTEIVMTANLREWRHILQLRTSKAAHPQMRALMVDCLHGFKQAVPVVFDDIGS